MTSSCDLNKEVSYPLCYLYVDVLHENKGSLLKLIDNIEIDLRVLYHYLYQGKPNSLVFR